MTNAPEFWLAYHFLSRGNAAPSTQLIELESPQHKLVDLEDVLDYAAPPYDDYDYVHVNDFEKSLQTDIQVFRQGFVEPQFRPVATWVRKDNVPAHSSDLVEELLKQGVGKCAESAIKLLVEDAPSTMWFTYHYVHDPCAKVSVQRARLNQGHKFEHLAHLTNYVFAQGYLPCNYRPLVHWETSCGKKLGEGMLVTALLSDGFGITENKAIKLVIDGQPFHHRFHQAHEHHSSCGCETRHHAHPTSPCEHRHQMAPCRPHTPSSTAPSTPTCRTSPVHGHNCQCPF